MDKVKSVETIKSDFLAGQRKGNIFNFLVTKILPLTVLGIIIFSLVNTSNRYVSSEQEALLKLENKTNELKQKEHIINEKTLKIDALADDLSKYKTQVALYTDKLSKVEQENKILYDRNKMLQRENITLKRRQGFKTYAWYQRGKTAKNKVTTGELVSRYP